MIDVHIPPLWLIQNLMEVTIDISEKPIAPVVFIRFIVKNMLLLVTSLLINITCATRNFRSAIVEFDSWNAARGCGLATNKVLG